MAVWEHLGRVDRDAVEVRNRPTLRTREHKRMRTPPIYLASVIEMRWEMRTPTVKKCHNSRAARKFPELRRRGGKKRGRGKGKKTMRTPLPLLISAQRPTHLHHDCEPLCFEQNFHSNHSQLPQHNFFLQHCRHKMKVGHLLDMLPAIVRNYSFPISYADDAAATPFASSASSNNNM